MSIPPIQIATRKARADVGIDGEGERCEIDILSTFDIYELSMDPRYAAANAKMTLTSLKLEIASMLVSRSFSGRLT